MSIKVYLILVLWLGGGAWVFSQQSLVKYTDIGIVSGVNGDSLNYVEILPENFEINKKYDLIIALHGHGSDRWQFAINERPECLAFRNIASEYGMIAISPDYGSKTSWMGPAAESELLQIIEEIKGKLKIGKLFLVGGSMGATSALTFAALHPDLVDGVTSMNGHANHLEYQNFQEAIIESFGGTKQEVPEEYKKRSAEYWPEKLTMPMAFTVGEFDKSVPPESIYRLVHVLNTLNRKVIMIQEPKGGHSTDLFDAMAAMEFMIKSQEE